MEARRGLSRRSFLKGVAATGAVGIVGMATTGCSSGPSGATSNGTSVNWDRKTDIVILGTGAAGLCAAITAARSGVDVIVCEKAPQEEEGGNTRVSGNAWTIGDDVEEAMKYYKAASERDEDDGYLRALVTTSSTLNDDFLATLSDGIDPTPFAGFSPEFKILPGGDAIKSFSNNGAANAQLYKPLRAEADLYDNIEWLYETPGTRLVTDNEGAVTGIVVAPHDGEITIQARKAVILACGGYEHNASLLENSYPGWPVYSRGTPYNTGDGILMAQKVGAGLWHMNASDCGGGAVICKGLDYGNGRYDSDEVPANLSITQATPKSQGFIFVDKNGKRFMAEDRQDSHGYGRREYYFWYDGVTCEWPNLPYWTIFDEAQAQSGAICAGKSKNSLFTWFAAYSNYEWSKDNSEEVKKGWILKSDTIEDLAGNMAVDPATLQQTLTTYNGFASIGKDSDLNRAPDTMRPLSGPFYAVQTYPNQYNTQGGPKRNEKSQTLDSFGEVIPRLYSCGECGAGYGWVYNGGWNVCEAMITGVWAGTDAAALESWTS